MTPEQQIKALGTHLQDQIEAATEKVRRDIAFLEGHCDNDPFDLRYLEPAEFEGRKCEHNDTLTCGKQPGESCQDCPVWKEIDGE